MAENLNCTVVTPVQTIFSDEAEYVGLPGEVGGFGVMKGHEPLVSTLGPGVVKITASKSGKDTTKYVISGGYAEIRDNGVIVLADKAVALADIDLNAVKGELAKAEESLKGLPEGDASRAYYKDQCDWLNLQIASVSADR